MSMLNQSMQDFLGIEFVEFTDTKALALMKVTEKTCQPFGFANGGAMLALAEILAGKASQHILPENKIPLGTSISANHIASTPLGSSLKAIATLVHKGSMHHVFDVKIFNEKRLLSIATVTNTIVDKDILFNVNSIKENKNTYLNSYQKTDNALLDSNDKETLIDYQTSFDKYTSDSIFNALMKSSTKKAYYNNIAITTIKMMVRNSKNIESTLKLLPSCIKFSPFVIDHPIKDFNLLEKNPIIHRVMKKLVERYGKKKLNLKHIYEDSKINYDGKNQGFNLEKKISSLNILYSELILDALKEQIDHKSLVIDKLSKILNIIRNNELSQKIKESNEKNVYTISFAIDVLNLLYKDFAIFPLKDSNELCLIVSCPKDILSNIDLNDLSNKSGFIFYPFEKTKQNNSIFYKVDNNTIIGTDNIINYAINLVINIFAYMLIHATISTNGDLVKTCNYLLYIIYTQRHNIDVFKRNYDIYTLFKFLKNCTPDFFADKEDFIDDKKSFEIYKNAFNKGKEFLASASCQKLVLSRRNDFSIKSTVGEIFKECLNKYHKKAFTYLIKHNVMGVWLGASPEILATFKDKAFKTMSLAGTMPIGDGLTEFVWSLKNKKEQELVTSYIEKTIQEFNVRYTKGPTHTVKAGPVVHLKTELCAKIDDKATALKLSQALNPTPAVCGLPKNEVKAFLLDNEGYDREYYSGITGYINQDSFALFVNLRCMKIMQQCASIYVGGGILNESTLDDEFNETCHKLKTMRSLFLLNESD